MTACIFLTILDALFLTFKIGAKLAHSDVKFLLAVESRIVTAINKICVSGQLKFIATISSYHQ